MYTLGYQRLPAACLQRQRNPSQQVDPPTRHAAHGSRPLNSGDGLVEPIPER